MSEAVIKELHKPQGRRELMLCHPSRYSLWIEAALNLAKAASGTYKPATADGKPVAGYFNRGVKFSLHK